MGDIRCSKCGEPWDADTLHDEIASRLQDGRGFLVVDKWGTAKVPHAFKPLRVPASPYGAESRGKSYAELAPARERYDKAYAKAYASMRAEWRARGCAAIESYGAHCSAAPILSADGLALVGLVDELAGDDVDELVSDLADAEYLGLFS